MTLAPVLTGWDALDVAFGANEAMTRAARNVGRPGIAATAISAADIALWDLKARLLGCAVTDLACAGAPRGTCLRQWRIHQLRREPDPGPADRLGG